MKANLKHFVSPKFLFSCICGYIKCFSFINNFVTDGCKDVISEVVEPVEKLSTPLNTSWGIVKTLYLTSQQLMPPFQYLGLHDRARRARSAKYISKAIYNACKVCITQLNVLVCIHKLSKMYICSKIHF